MGIVREKSILMVLSLLLALFTTHLVTAQAVVIDLDARGGYYSGSIITPAGVVLPLYFSVARYSTVVLTVTPTVSIIEVTVRNPDGGIVKTLSIREKTSITLNIDIKGVWTIELASPEDQTVYIEITGIGGTTPMPPPGPAIPLEYIIAIVGGGAIVIIALVAIFILRKPAPPPTPVKQPPTPPTTPGGEETVVLEKKPPITVKETEIMIAALELPSGGVIPITSPRQIFGRADFERHVDPSLLTYISRRHFMITLEPGGFFIEDLGSANGTTVNDADIRGKGKVQLKPGDIIGVGGILKLKFRTGG